MDGQTSSKNSLSLLDPVLGYREKLAGHLRFLSTLHNMIVSIKCLIMCYIVTFKIGTKAANVRTEVEVEEYFFGNWPQTDCLSEIASHFSSLLHAQIIQKGNQSIQHL